MFCNIPHKNPDGTVRYYSNLSGEVYPNSSSNISQPMKIETSPSPAETPPSLSDWALAIPKGALNLTVSTAEIIWNVTFHPDLVAEALYTSAKNCAIKTWSITKNHGIILRHAYLLEKCPKDIKNSKFFWDRNSVSLFSEEKMQKADLSEEQKTRLRNELEQFNATYEALINYVPKKCNEFMKLSGPEKITAVTEQVLPFIFPPLLGKLALSVGNLRKFGIWKTPFTFSQIYPVQRLSVKCKPIIKGITKAELRKCTTTPGNPILYTITADGKLTLSRRKSLNVQGGTAIVKHPELCDAANVVCAGEITMKNGFITRIDNRTGHYKVNELPDGKHTLKQIVETTFKRHGFEDAAGKYVDRLDQGNILSAAEKKKIRLADEAKYNNRISNATGITLDLAHSAIESSLHKKLHEVSEEVKADLAKLYPKGIPPEVCLDLLKQDLSESDASFVLSELEKGIHAKDKELAAFNRTYKVVLGLAEERNIQSDRRSENAAAQAGRNKELFKYACAAIEGTLDVINTLERYHEQRTAFQRAGKSIDKNFAGAKAYLNDQLNVVRKSKKHSMSILDSDLDAFFVSQTSARDIQDKGRQIQEFTQRYINKRDRLINMYQEYVAQKGNLQAQTAVLNRMDIEFKKTFKKEVKKFDLVAKYFKYNAVAITVTTAVGNCIPGIAPFVAPIGAASSRANDLGNKHFVQKPKEKLILRYNNYTEGSYARHSSLHNLAMHNEQTNHMYMAEQYALTSALLNHPEAFEPKERLNQMDNAIKFYEDLIKQADEVIRVEGYKLTDSKTSYDVDTAAQTRYLKSSSSKKRNAAANQIANNNVNKALSEDLIKNKKKDKEVWEQNLADLKKSKEAGLYTFSLDQSTYDMMTESIEKSETEREKDLLLQASRNSFNRGMETAEALRSPEKNARKGTLLALKDLLGEISLFSGLKNLDAISLLTLKLNQIYDNSVTIESHYSFYKKQLEEEGGDHSKAIQILTNAALLGGFVIPGIQTAAAIVSTLRLVHHLSFSLAIPEQRKDKYIEALTLFAKDSQQDLEVKFTTLKDIIIRNNEQMRAHFDQLENHLLISKNEVLTALDSLENRFVKKMDDQKYQDYIARIKDRGQTFENELALSPRSPEEFTACLSKVKMALKHMRTKNLNGVDLFYLAGFDRFSPSDLALSSLYATKSPTFLTGFLGHELKIERPVPNFHLFDTVASQFLKIVYAYTLENKICYGSSFPDETRVALIKTAGKFLRYAKRLKRVFTAPGAYVDKVCESQDAVENMISNAAKNVALREEKLLKAALQKILSNQKDSNGSHLLEKNFIGRDRYVFSELIYGRLSGVNADVKPDLRALYEQVRYYRLSDHALAHYDERRINPFVEGVGLTAWKLARIGGSGANELVSMIFRPLVSIKDSIVPETFQSDGMNDGEELDAIENAFKENLLGLHSFKNLDCRRGERSFYEFKRKPSRYLKKSHAVFSIAFDNFERACIIHDVCMNVCLWPKDDNRGHWSSHKKLGSNLNTKSILACEIKLSFSDEFKSEILFKKESLITHDDYNSIPILPKVDLNKLESNLKLLIQSYLDFLYDDSLRSDNVFHKIKGKSQIIPSSNPDLVPLAFPYAMINHFRAALHLDDRCVEEAKLAFIPSYDFTLAEDKKTYQLSLRYRTQDGQDYCEFIIAHVDLLTVNSFKKVSIDTPSYDYTIGEVNLNEFLLQAMYTSFMEGLGLPGKESVKLTHENLVAASDSEYIGFYRLFEKYPYVSFDSQSDTNAAPSELEHRQLRLIPSPAYLSIREDVIRHQESAINSSKSLTALEHSYHILQSLCRLSTAENSQQLVNRLNYQLKITPPAEFRSIVQKDMSLRRTQQDVNDFKEFISRSQSIELLKLKQLTGQLKSLWDLLNASEPSLSSKIMDGVTFFFRGNTA